MNIGRFIMAFIYLTLPLQIGIATLGLYFLETKIKGFIEVRANNGKRDNRRVR